MGGGNAARELEVVEEEEAAEAKDVLDHEERLERE